MTRRSVRSLDPEAEDGMASLPEGTRQRLHALRLRFLMAPAIKKNSGKDPEPLSESEKEALSQLGRRLSQRTESES